jgi:hypothetical protein
VDTFFATLDAIITEVDHRFSELYMELLICISCLDPRDSFSKFGNDKIARLTEIYDQDFSNVDHTIIRDQLETFILPVWRADDFIACHDLGSFAIKMVQIEKHLAFTLVYRLIELALLLLVAITSFERTFSVMNIIKTGLPNKMLDNWLNDLIMCYIEKNILKILNVIKLRRQLKPLKTQKYNWLSLQVLSVLSMDSDMCILIIFSILWNIWFFRYHHLLNLFLKLTGLLFMCGLYMVQIVSFTSYFYTSNNRYYLDSCTCSYMCACVVQYCYSFGFVSRFHPT